MDLILDALFGLLTGGTRGPRMDPMVAVAAVVLGLVTGVFMYSRLFDNGGAGLIAWIAIPMAATFIVATALGRRHAVRGALLSAGTALVVGLPFALMDLMFSPWSGS